MSSQIFISIKHFDHLQFINPSLQSSAHLITNEIIQIMHLVHPSYSKTLTPTPSCIDELPKHFFSSQNA